MVLNYKCEINDFKLVCPLTVFDRLFQRTAALKKKLFFPTSVYSLCAHKLCEFLRLHEYIEFVLLKV